MTTHINRPTLRIRDLNFGVRVALTLLAIVVLGGSAVSGWYLREHFDNRDEKAGLTFDDIRAQYHGITAKSPMLAALERGHPEGLDPKMRTALINWLKSDRVAQDYDNFDLGDMAPETIIAENCLSCHSADASGPNADPALSLQYFDQVRDVSISREVRPVDIQLIATSLHVHALGLASLTLITVLLLGLTRGPRWLTGSVSTLTALGLLADLGAWIPAHEYSDAFVYLIVGGGFAFQAGLVLSLVIIVADLWLPRRRVTSEPGI